MGVHFYVGENNNSAKVHNQWQLFKPISKQQRPAQTPQLHVKQQSSSPVVLKLWSQTEGFSGGTRTDFLSY